MGTAILGSRDYLAGRIRHETLTPFKSRFRNPNPNFSNSRRRKRGPGGFQSEKSNALVMGQVRILKRGESLTENRMMRAKKIEEEADLVLGSTDRLGPDPETVKKQIEMKDVNKFVDAMYAGSAFLTSPPPSSLPVPGFLGKRCNGAATSDLRRLLGLD